MNRPYGLNFLIPRVSAVRPEALTGGSWGPPQVPRPGSKASTLGSAPLTSQPGLHREPPDPLSFVWDHLSDLERGWQLLSLSPGARNGLLTMEGSGPLGTDSAGPACHCLTCPLFEQGDSGEVADAGVHLAASSSGTVSSV